MTFTKIRRAIAGGAAGAAALMGLGEAALAHSGPIDISYRLRVLEHEHLHNRTVRHRHGAIDWHLHEDVAFYAATRVARRTCKTRTYICWKNRDDADFTDWVEQDEYIVRLDKSDAGTVAHYAAHTPGGTHTHDGHTEPPPSALPQPWALHVEEGTIDLVEGLSAEIVVKLKRKGVVGYSAPVDIPLRFSTSGTATPGEDYREPGEVTLRKGQSSVSFTFRTVNPGTYEVERDESVAIAIGHGLETLPEKFASFEGTEAHINIVDNDVVEVKWDKVIYETEEGDTVTAKIVYDSANADVECLVGFDTHVRVANAPHTVTLKEDPDNPLPPDTPQYNPNHDLNRDLPIERADAYWLDKIVTVPPCTNVVEVPIGNFENDIVERQTEQMFISLHPVAGNPAGLRVNSRSRIDILDDDETTLTFADTAARQIDGETWQVATYTAAEGGTVEVAWEMSAAVEFLVRVGLNSATDGYEYGGNRRIEPYTAQGTFPVVLQDVDADTTVHLKFDPSLLRFQDAIIVPEKQLVEIHIEDSAGGNIVSGEQQGEQGPSPGVLEDFVLLDASDQSRVAAVADGADIDLEDRSGGSFAIRAEVEANAEVGSIVLSLSGAKTVSRTENLAPYSLYGDDMQGTLYGGTLPAGTYTLSATAYAERHASGAVLGTRSVSFEVLALPALTVADAQAREGTDATLDFAVTLDREPTGTVTVEYATSDGTAVAGADYTATSGTLTFAAGETEKTVPVPVLGDEHDEGSETLTLRLSNAEGATIADGEAAGTITNSDPIPAAWLARFGRTVTGQVLEAVEARLAAPREAGAELSLAGQPLPSGRSGDAAAAAEQAEDEARAALASMTAWLAQADDDAGPQPRALTGRDLVTGTSFALSAGSREGGGSASLWGRGGVATFDGRGGDLALDGEVTTGLIGADWAKESWTAGLALGHSTGMGGYRGADGSGDIEAALTGLYPYAGLAAGERLTLWAAGGLGSGEVTVTPEGQAGLTADLSLSMAAAGLRSEVLRPQDGNGLALALKGDARFTRTSSEAAPGMEAADADVWLLRTGLEGAQDIRLGGGASATPSFELGLRLDGGDAETGMGADLGGGLTFADPAQGLAFDFKARGLVAHAASGFREWGASFAASWDPRPATDRGLSLSLTQSWGAAPSGGMDALLSRETLADLAANEAGGNRFEASSRLEGEFGYGVAMFGGVFTGTPNIGFGLSDGGARDWRLGWRLTLAVRGSPGFEVSLDASRREPANDNGSGSGTGSPEHEAMLRAAIRW